MPLLTYKLMFKLKGDWWIVENEKLKNYLSKGQNPYKINVENIVVTMEYIKTNKKFNECMVNILKQKRGK